ncbi:hypothetical protein K435DRAFT_617751, partial [Dendrothele bispora CBS 962.96]
HNGNPDDIYGAPDTLITRGQPRLHVSNFSQMPVVVNVGEVLGRAHDPNTWLDKSTHMSQEELARAKGYASFIKELSKTDRMTRFSAPIRSETKITSKAQQNATGEDDPSAEDPLEGGPKGAEVLADSVSSDRLLQEISLSPDLTKDQRRQLETVILQNQSAFGLDGRLGNYDSKVEITLKPGAQPVSLPPFPASPANREVI